MINENKIIDFFNSKRKFFIDNSYKSEKRFFSLVDVEQIVDDVLINVIKAKPSFVHENQIYIYLQKSIRKEFQKRWRMKAQEVLKIPMTNNERVKNFELARSIIDKSRGGR